jgi:predicted dehydrogenase
VSDRTWGIIGPGRVARQLARAIRETDGHRLVGVAGRSLRGAQSFVAETGDDVMATDSIDELLAAGAELIYIASPNDKHSEHIAEVIAAGRPVLCEKPLAASAAAARAIGAALLPQGPRLGVAFQYRQHPAHIRAREIVASGVLGELRMVSVSGCLPALDVPAWYDDPAISGGGILPMSGVHRVDVVRFILDQDYTEVQATTGHHRGQIFDDTASIIAELASGASCIFQFGLDAPYGDDRIAVHGTAGSLFVDSTMSQWWSSEPGSITVRTAEGTERTTYEDVDNYALQVQAFARYASGDDAANFATAADALAVAVFTEGTYRAAREGRPVRL